MKLIQITPEYYESVRLLRNNPMVKAGFIVQNHISKEEQITYMDKHSKDYWVCLDNDIFVGYIGVVDNDIRVCVMPGHQHKDIGVFMVGQIKVMFPNAQAKIMINNDISLKLFTKVGYKIKYYLLEAN